MPNDIPAANNRTLNIVNRSHIQKDNNMSWPEVKLIWRNLHEEPALRKGLRPEIYDSWERSYDYHIDRNMRQITHHCSTEELSRALYHSRYMTEIAIPIMERLLEFVKGTGFLVSLNDANCVSLKIIGDQKSLDWARQNNMIEGTIWTEDKVGTNGLALCISQVKPISVYAYEHYCLFAITGASSFAPIIDNGHVIGSIGMVAPYQHVTHHTLGMVVAAADHIQSTLVLNRISKYQQVITDSMSDGVMVVNLNGQITYINQQCLKILGLVNKKPIGDSIHDLFGKNPENQLFINIATQGRMVTDESLVIHNDSLQIHCNITCTPLSGPNLYDSGSVIIFRENARINKIVGNWIGRSAKMSFDDIIGQTPRFQEIKIISQMTAKSNSNVLLLGESGTGKDILAQAMHNESPRKKHPFLAINCAALPRELIASELFGYEEGAFTGAKKGGNAGKFELANEGTLFLDEIGDVPLDLQVSLLRVLDEKAVMRLGGSQIIPVNVRIMAATNKKLEEEILRNRFRRDLYYRLGVIKLNIPPLRERRDDIPLLVAHFLGLICSRFGQPLKKMSPPAMQMLIKYDWPGNIRELQNILEGAVQLAPGEEIDAVFLANYMDLEDAMTVAASDQRTVTEMTIDEEKTMLINCLKHNFYNKSKAAEELNISRQSLYRRLHKHNLLK